MAARPGSTTAVVVPAAVRAHPEVLARFHVSPDTLLRWARVKSLYAREPHNGRQVIVRPDTLAGLLQCSERTVQRCNAAARAIGLELSRDWRDERRGGEQAVRSPRWDYSGRDRDLGSAHGT